jgi:hypothetical protein
VARKQRIDTVIKGIKKGDYDDKLGQIQAAVENRQDHKRAQVLAKVFEVYGENYTIVPKDEVVSKTSSGSKRFHFADGETIVTDQSPESDEGNQVSPLEIDQVDPEELDEKDIESRSPIIGPYEA